MENQVPVVSHHPISALVLPEDGPWRRDARLRPSAQGPDFPTRYDFTTLAYSAIWRPRERALVLVCPRLLNLAALVRQGRFASDLGDHPLRRIRSWRRYDEVWLDAPVRPQALTFTAEGLTLACDVIGPDPAFSGRNVLSAISQNNRLEWITDWVAHGVRNQGLEAVLLYDNASTIYTPADIAGALAEVPGLKAARVVSVPMRYGPHGTRVPRRIAKFLQTGLLNISRLGPLAEARAVMLCDVDELPASDGETMFEAVARSRLGYLCAMGHYRHEQVEDDRLPRHGDHIWRDEPDKQSKEKYVIRMDGPLARIPWEVHGLHRYEFNWLAKRRDHRFYHCSGIYSGWRARRNRSLKAGGVIDEPTRRDMERFGLRGA